MQRRNELPRSRFTVRIIASSAFAAAFGLISSALAADVERNPDRNAYFGETHQHTSWSFDAFIFGNHITGPADAYKYYMGETIKHPLGYDI
jgi:hypothetical protein